MTNSKAFKAWSSMIYRSTIGGKYQDQHPTYKEVGRSPKWETFEGFFEEMGPPPSDHVLSRIGDTGDYSKENCRWVTKSQNLKEMSDRYAKRTSSGEIGIDLARKNGINDGTYWSRISKSGWSVDDACTIPV
jgi:hypothetical protein